MPSNRVIPDGAAMPGHGTKFGSNRVVDRVVEPAVVIQKAEADGATNILEGMTKDTLLAAATALGVEASQRTTKAEIIAAIKSQTSDDTTA
jgi:hypothetical protein